MRRILALLIILTLVLTAGYLLYNIDHQSAAPDDDDTVETTL